MHFHLLWAELSPLSASRAAGQGGASLLEPEVEGAVGEEWSGGLRRHTSDQPWPDKCVGSWRACVFREGTCHMLDYLSPGLGGQGSHVLNSKPDL